MALRKEKSCGCIIISGGKVLLVYEERRDFWDFPKGHMEPGETELDTALREVRDEVGLDVALDTSHRYTLNYVIRDEIDKEVVLFAASPTDTKLNLQSEEIGKAKWCDFDEALELLTFDEWKNAFRHALSDLSA